MKKSGSPCHSPPDVFKCYSTNECSRADIPRVGSSARPVFPVRGYWIPETPPVPVHYRAVYAAPPPAHGQAWYPNPGGQYGYSAPRLLLATPPPPPPPLPPPPFCGPCVYNQTISHHPHYLRTHRDIIVEKLPIQATPTSNSSNGGFSISQKLNPSESPVKQRPSSKSTWEETFVTQKHKKRKSSRKKLVDKVQVQIKEEIGKYSYNKSSDELHPEILATWRKNLNESKESSSTHKVKIEICLKKETVKQNQSIEGGKTVHEKSDLKITQCFKEREKEKCSPQSKHHKKMSSPVSTDDEKSSLKDGSNSTRDKKLSTFEEKNSALRFTPSQIQKVHKRKKEGRYTSILKRSNYTPIVVALETCRSTENGVSPTKNSSRTSDRERSLESRSSNVMQESSRSRENSVSPIKSGGRTSDRDRSSESRISNVREEASRSRDNSVSPTKNRSRTSDRDRSSKSRISNVTEESRRSTNKSERDSDSGLETYRSREEYSRSPTKSSLTNSRSSVSSRKSSSSALKSCSSTRKYEHDSDSDVDETQNSSIYVTPEGTPFSMKSKTTEERLNSRFKRSLSDEQYDESHSANSSFNTSGYYTPESSPSKFNSAKRLKIRWSDTSSFSQDKTTNSSWRLNTSYNFEQGIQPELIGYQMVGDSQFCRFGQQLLGLERVPMPNSPGRIGICVSGQTITDLHRRVKDNFYPISDKIILMIGTNDFLRNVDVSTMCEELSALIKTLQKSASNIILLTLPPIPKLEKKSTAHFKLLDVYNSHIRGLENGESLRIADISPLYMTSPPYQRCKMHLFEVYFGGAAKRLDLIHLNRLGLEMIRKYILDKFLL